MLHPALRAPLAQTPIPRPGDLLDSEPLPGAAVALAAASLIERHQGICLFVTRDTQTAEELVEALDFFLAPGAFTLLSLPDWETLPYDVFSPHQDIISRRLLSLFQLPGLRRGALVLPINTLLQRLPPRAWLGGQCLMLDRGQRIDPVQLRSGFEAVGYRHVQQVMEHGEYAVRGAILDVFPMGSEMPYRIDLLDDEIESVRSFDPQTQRSLETFEQVRLLPAHEFPLNEEGIKHFRQQYRERLAGDPNASQVYREVSQGAAPAGIEYYQPLFFKHMESLFEYLPDNCLCVHLGDIHEAGRRFASQVADRFEQRRHDPERPILPPGELFVDLSEVEERLGRYPQVRLNTRESSSPEDFRLQARQGEPAVKLRRFLDEFPGRILFMTESAGRREMLIEILRPQGIQPQAVDSWQQFLSLDRSPAIGIGPLQEGVVLQGDSLAIITETELWGRRARQERRRRKHTRDADAVIRNLTDLHPGAPVVHEDHGVGRYLGLQVLDVGGQKAEFLALEYAGGSKLYVPVGSLHLVGRYTGADPENAPLHRLGTDSWAKARRKAAEKARDVAAELLEIYARRAARKGHAHVLAEADYAAFAAAFPFEETPDQASAIQAVLQDMASERPMDRVICGDVGFGKTEVAMRAAFVAVQGGKQVAVLVPTTLLAQQHETNFRDRFADWPVRIEALSRFGSRGQQQAVIEGLADGRVDIVIGTHKLIQGGIQFKRLGLVIIDEEQRFGVRHKEQLKALRAEVDMLTLTATPIPRTLNMALAGLRDMSIIATPPEDRLAIKTFVSQGSNALIQEACWRELRRGGQVYYLHNEVKSIDKAARELQALLPEARIGVAHGQMPEKELEQVMLDFYHRRFNILVCSTIIESGIDVPTANTIIIDRADKLGLSQLHQLRGRVGRSHHRAYAYLLTPHPSGMTPDAVKRLEAIASLEELGVGFTLASHDLEIRGAGELLGEEQSGQIQEIGFGLYNELLDRAVKSLRAGKTPDPGNIGHRVTEVDMGMPSLLPDDFVPDVHTRLILYKRLSACASEDEVRDMEVELIDRFGLLPPQAKNLVAASRMRLQLQPLGVRKIEFGPEGGRLLFHDMPEVDPASVIGLIQSDPVRYRLDGPDKLRFKCPLPDLGARMKLVEVMLGVLRPLVS